MQHKKQTYSNSGFTLVELIVVIVILSILATIAFLSFGSQSSSARDSIRVSDISALSKGLGVVSTTTGKYPSPDKSVSIWNSGMDIGMQGEVGTGVKLALKASSDGFTDPLDKANYTYVSNKAGTLFRLGAYLETNDNISLDTQIGNDIAGATEYNEDSRYLYLKGDDLPVIYLDNGNIVTPLQDIEVNTNGVTSTGIDLSVGATNSGILAIKENGSTAETINSNIMINYNPSRYPGCDSIDISIGEQIWAACNVGASKSKEYQKCNEENIAECTTDRVGKFFQWGNSYGFTAPFDKETTSTGKIDTTGIGDSTYSSSILILGTPPVDEAGNPTGEPDRDWSINTNPNLWGGVTNTVLAMKGPCSNGYHIPSLEDWNRLYENIGCDAACQSDFGSQVNGEAMITSIRNKLLMPSVGTYDANEGVVSPHAVGGRWRYWYSTQKTGSDQEGAETDFSSRLESSDYKMTLLPIRCIKN